MKKFYTKIKLLILSVSIILFSSPVFSQTIFINSGATLSIAAEATLLADELINSGTLNILSATTGTGNLILNSASGTGTTNVQRYLPSANWHIVSSPVGGQQMGSFATSQSLKSHPTIANTYALAPYSENGDNWDPYTLNTNTSTFAAGNGYVASKSAEGVVTFTGTSINTGTVTVPIVSTTYGWNAIGNPYTSSIITKGAGGFLTVNTAAIHDTYEGLYIWDQATSDYVIIASGGFPFPGGESELAQDAIAVGQGFIVRSVDGGSSVEFNSIMQDALPDAVFKSAEEPEPAIRLTASAGELHNTTIVAFNTDKTFGLDPGYDLGKLKGNPDIALYSQLVDKSSDVDFAIQTVPNTDFKELSIPMGLDLPNGGVLSFSLEYMHLPYYAEVYLEDTQLNTLTRLDKEDAVYNVNLASAEGYGRFNLVFQNFSETITAINDNIDSEATFKVFINQKKIIVDGPASIDTQVSVYSIDGKKWYQEQAHSGNRNVIDANGFATGIYLVRIENSIGTSVHKVIIASE